MARNTVDYKNVVRAVEHAIKEDRPTRTTVMLLLARTEFGNVSGDPENVGKMIDHYLVDKAVKHCIAQAPAVTTQPLEMVLELLSRKEFGSRVLHKPEKIAPILDAILKARPGACPVAAPSLPPAAEPQPNPLELLFGNVAEKFGTILTDLKGATLAASVEQAANHARDIAVIVAASGDNSKARIEEAETRASEAQELVDGAFGRLAELERQISEITHGRTGLELPPSPVAHPAPAEQNDVTNTAEAEPAQPEPAEPSIPLFDALDDTAREPTPPAGKKDGFTLVFDDGKTCGHKHRTEQSAQGCLVGKGRKGAVTQVKGGKHE